MKRIIIVIVSILAIVFVGVGAVAIASAPQVTASCTANPVVTDAGTTQNFTVKCKVPKPPATTVTVPGPTQTVTVTTSPSVTPTVTPTPTATATPTNPPTGSYPDASNTGVPAGMVLTKVPSQKTSGNGWTWDASDKCITINTAGVTVSGLDISGCIEVHANNVTLSNNRVTQTGNWWAVGVWGVSGVTVKDSTLSGGGSLMEVGIKDVTGGSEITVLGNNISDWTTGVQMSRGLVQDNYIHDPASQTAVNAGGYHVNGFTDNGGRTDGTMVVRHNTILNPRNQTDAISFFEDFGAIKNVTADNNLIAGGSYTLYAGHNDGGPDTSNVVITNNQFSTIYGPLSAGYGPACCYQSNQPGNVWSGNVWYDGPNKGQAVPAP